MLADEFFVRLLATDIAIGLGFGFLFAFMPAYASSLGIDKTTIGVLFTFGAASVVLTQIPTLRWVRGRPRMALTGGDERVVRRRVRLDGDHRPRPDRRWPS